MGSPENNGHYSKQNGHKKRGVVNKSLVLAQEVFGRPVSKGEIVGVHPDKVHIGKRKMLRPPKPPGRKS